MNHSNYSVKYYLPDILAKETIKSHLQLKNLRAFASEVFAMTPIFSADLAKLYLCFPPLIPYLRGQYFSAHRLVYVRVVTAESNGHPDSR